MGKPVGSKCRGPYTRGSGAAGADSWLGGDSWAVQPWLECSRFPTAMVNVEGWVTHGPYARGCSALGPDGDGGCMGAWVTHGMGRGPVSGVASFPRVKV